MRIWSLSMKHLNVQNGKLARARRFSLQTKMASVSVSVNGIMRCADYFFLRTFGR